MEMVNVVDWLELDRDLIELILTRLIVLVDFITFGAVCKTWRSIFLKSGHRLLHRPPVLIFPITVENYLNNKIQSFFSLSEKQTYRLNKLSDEDNNRRCCGSSDGYLIIEDNHLNISLLNPFTRTETPLPRHTTLPYAIDARLTDTGIIKYTYQFPSNHRWALSGKSIENGYVHKAITAGPYVVAILAFQSILAFCRRDGGTWTYVESDWCPFVDVVCYNDKFYAVNKSGHVVALDVSGPHPTVTKVAMSVGVREILCVKYLVESSGQLLMVVKRYDRKNMLTCMITRFDIFRVDMNKHMCVPLKALGDSMLFLGKNCSMSRSAQDFSDCEGNCIYFTPEQKVWYPQDTLCVYNVEDGSIKPYYKMGLKWFLPCPIWLTPKPW